MIFIKDVKTLEGDVVDYQIVSNEDVVIDAKKQLLMLPGFIDSHICLGSFYEQSWKQSIQSIIRGGITTIIDIPHKEIPCDTKKGLEQKRLQIEDQLDQLKLPLRFLFYSFPNFEHVYEMGLMKPLTKGVAIVLTAELDYVWDDEAWDRVFQLAAWEDLPIVVNSRNENQTPFLSDSKNTLLEKALYYTEKQGTRLYILNVNALHELELIKQARAKQLLIYVETTPKHLFPLYSYQADFLWDAINKGIIDAIGTGFHAGIADSESISIDNNSFNLTDPCLFLPFLITAYTENKISLEKIVQTTCLNVCELFKMEKTEDVILIDLNREWTAKRVSQEQSMPIKLKGALAYTILQGQIFNFLDHTKIDLIR